MDGENAPVTRNGNFILGPTHTPATESVDHPKVPHGKVYEFTMSSAESKLYPGIARDDRTFGTPDPHDPATLLVPTSHPAPYTRHVAVYVPAQYEPGTAAPLLVGADGPDRLLFTVLDNLIAEGKVPAIVAVSIGNGGGDAQGSERGLEYDTLSGRYSDFVETEVLPRVEAETHVTLTHDPDGRATTGGSSGGAAALIMAWYHPERYHRVLAYSGTWINQQWPHNPATPHGAWGFAETLIPGAPRKPLRLWMEVGDRDLFNPNVMRDGMHDWVVANEDMARALAAKGYPYQFVFAENAAHVDRAVREQTLPEALEWLWRVTQPQAEQGRNDTLKSCLRCGEQRRFLQRRLGPQFPDAVWARNQGQRGHAEEKAMLDDADNVADLSSCLFRLLDETAMAVQDEIALIGKPRPGAGARWTEGRVEPKLSEATLHKGKGKLHHLDGQRKPSKVVDDLGFIGDHDELLRCGSDDLFAKMRPAATLDGQTRSDLVSTIDVDVEDRSVLKGGKRDAKFACQRRAGIRGGDGLDPQAGLHRFAQLTDKKRGCRPGAKADVHAIGDELDGTSGSLELGVVLRHKDMVLRPDV